MPIIPELEKQMQKDGPTFEASLVYTVNIQATKVHNETLSPKPESKEQQHKKIP